MKLKIDENLPGECPSISRQHGFEADSVAGEGLTGSDGSTVLAHARAENRTLITPGSELRQYIWAYPPAKQAGIVVIRSKYQDKNTVLRLIQRLVPVLANRSLEGELWIVESDRIRFRIG